MLQIGFEGTFYNRCACSYLSFYDPFSSNLQIPIEKQSKNQQRTRLIKKCLNVSTAAIAKFCLSNKSRQSHIYATGGFEGTCYNRCTGSYLSSYRPFSSNLQQLVTPKNAVKKMSKIPAYLGATPQQRCQNVG